MANGQFTEQVVADYLGINRTTYDNYESGIREMPFDLMQKVAELLGCDLGVLISGNESDINDMLVCAFRADKLNAEDCIQIAKFKKMVLNYLKISRLLNNGKVKAKGSILPDVDIEKYVCSQLV